MFKLSHPSYVVMRVTKLPGMCGLRLTNSILITTDPAFAYSTARSCFSNKYPNGAEIQQVVIQSLVPEEIGTQTLLCVLTPSRDEGDGIKCRFRNDFEKIASATIKIPALIS